MHCITKKEKAPSGGNGFLNRKKQSFMPDTRIQRKLSIGSANDRYEHEADAVADKVVSMSKPRVGTVLQRKCAACEEKDGIQMKSLHDGITPLIQKSGEAAGHGIASNDVTTRINNSRGSGNKMDVSTRSDMENSFGTDFSSVNIHTGANAVQLSKELNAQAFTVGNDIYFNEGKYNPSSTSGKHLLAHELTHTVQQGGIRRKKIQRSCHDGNCASCIGGMKTLDFTVFFRIRATRANMRRIRAIINEAKRDFRTCCINARFFFNWRLLRGGGAFDPGRARAAGNANGSWDYSNDAETLGEGNTFNGVRGVPVVFVDSVPRTGGGVTMDSRYDRQYTGTTYMSISVNQPGAIASTFAHEFGHVAGLEHDSSKPANYIMNTGANIDADYCTATRAVSR